MVELAEVLRRLLDGRSGPLRGDKVAAAASELSEAAERRADQAEARAKTAEAERDQARADTAAAVQRAEALRQADDARKAGGRLARLRAAWRGD
jgi:hypothetical protein